MAHAGVVHVVHAVVERESKRVANAVHRAAGRGEVREGRGREPRGFWWRGGNGVGRDDDDGRRTATSRPARRGEGDTPGGRRSEARSRSGRRAGAPPRTAGRRRASAHRRGGPSGCTPQRRAPRARRGLRGTPAGAATEANMTSLLSTGRPPEKPRAGVCDQPGGREKGSPATATRAGSHTTPPSTAPSRVPIRMAPRRERRGLGGRESHPKI